MAIELQPMTRERMHEMYRGFSVDPAIFDDLSLYEQKKNYVYDPKKVDALFDLREHEEGSIAFAVMLDGAVIGEVGLRHFSAETRECELSIHLQNDAVKGLGHGTEAERLAVDYAFGVLGAESVFAETLVGNTRSQHILQKLGFRYLGEEDGFKRYRLRRRAMIKLAEVTEENWLDVASLSVKDSQREYLAPAIGILARGYVYRGCNARVFVIENDGVIVGVALVREFTDEPLGYDLQQFMIDGRYQGRGYGSAALGLILDELRKEGHFDHVEVCVKKADAEAIRLYEKHGFADSGYVDEDAPDSVNLICRLF